MNYNNNIATQASGVLRVSCSLLFMLFSFCYLSFLEGDILTEAQYVFSHGLTTYSIPVGAATLTIVLQLLQWLTCRVFKFPWQYYVLSYLPSLTALACLTHLCHDTITAHPYGSWTWVAPLLLLAYVLLITLLRKMRLGDNVDSIKPMLWQNYLLLLLMLVCCGAASVTTDIQCYELKTERLIMQGDYEGAAQVADRSLVSSRRLTELRMFALAKQGLLAERLFCYPQYYGASGLLSIADSSSLYRFSPQSICYSLGAIPDGRTIRSTHHYLGVMNREDSLRTVLTIDYHLCYLLLQKDLSRFAACLKKYYPQTATHLPQAYREAVLYINNVYGKEIQKLDYAIDSETTDMYNRYKALKEEISDSLERRNLTRRQFGNTFWWYYEFQKQMK